MTRTVDAARGKWKGILLTLGVAREFLTGKHTACPKCGGKDRFRFDDKEGRGTYFCSVCGAGSGMDLLQMVKGWPFAVAASEVDKIIGSVPVQRQRPVLEDGRRRGLLNEVWCGAAPVIDGDPVSQYLAGRGLTLPQNRLALRYASRCQVPGGRLLPAMIAMVTDVDGKPCTLHRTYLGANGKADIPEPRALMPGSVPEGAAVRLSMHGERLGIAEGIETALAASARFGLPVWSALNSAILAKWKPPEGVREVVVFGDNDLKFGGAAAAFALAHRLAARDGLSVEVRIPSKQGRDWADADAA